MDKVRIRVPHQKLVKFCRNNHIKKLAFFGSVLRDDFGPQSDVDVLVEFEPEHIPGFFGLGRMEQELSDMLGGRKVDLVTPKFLNRRIRQRVLESAEIQTS